MTRRPTRECAQKILDQLQPGVILTRAELVAKGVIIDSEAEFALRWLREIRAIRSRRERSSTRASAGVGYEATGTPLPTMRRAPSPKKSGPTRQASFEGLLRAWKIGPPLAPQRGLVRDLFAQEEAQEGADQLVLGTPARPTQRKRL